MALGTSLLPVAVPYVSINSHGTVTAAQLATAYGAGNIKTPSAHFSINYRGHTISFEKNVPKVVDAGLAAALSAAGAPVA